MNPSFQLVDTGWDKIIADAVASQCGELRVVCPFISCRTAKRLLVGTVPSVIRVITRFHLGEMYDGYNDTNALGLLLANGAGIRGVQNLHAKLYVFGRQHAIVTSANLTEAALFRNHEFGFVTSDLPIVDLCRSYFDALWKRAGGDLDTTRLDRWIKTIDAARIAASRPTTNFGLSDQGKKVWVRVPAVFVPTRAHEAPQAFVKFFGEGHNRASLTVTVLDEVSRSGSHWACTYPKTKRPRRVNDGAVMFMGRLVGNPNDTMIYGRAIAMRHVPGRDEASGDEINIRPWKSNWPMYIRVHHAEFVAGTLNNGVRLSALMDELKSEAFVSTQKHASSHSGNTDPRNAYRQQASVQLTGQGLEWLNEQLGLAFERHGKLTPAELETFDWPKTPIGRGSTPAHLEEYKNWLVTKDGKAVGTAAIYSRFLTRCAEHYGEQINEHTVRSLTDVNEILTRISPVVQSRGRWAKGTFNTFDLPANLAPALQAYSRFAITKL